MQITIPGWVALRQSCRVTCLRVPPASASSFKQGRLSTDLELSPGPGSQQLLKKHRQTTALEKRL